MSTANTNTNTKPPRQAIHRQNCIVLRERGRRGATSHSLVIACGGAIRIIPSAVFIVA